MGAVTQPGIEKIGVYPGSLALAMPDLCAAREQDPIKIRDAMMIDERSINPLWEDPVTMAVNAANSLLEGEDREKIELLIVASESGVDQEKPISTWAHRYLGLTPHCRNFELKHACYGGTAGLQMAASWVASGVSPGAKALIITTDQSRTHLGKPWEFVLGAGAAAILVSDQPRLVELELGKSGYWTYEIADLTRPTAKVETGNSETSLISYLEALEGAYAHFLCRAKPESDFDTYFQRHVYHAPFGGMTWRAHRTLLREWKTLSRDESWAHFQHKSLSALRYLRRMGGTYSGSTFIGLLAMIEADAGIRAGDRIAVFSYGSGSCAEFYCVKACEGAREIARAQCVTQKLDARRRLSVAEYECLERRRSDLVDEGDYQTLGHSPSDWFEAHYQGKGLLIYSGMRDYYRQYEWS
ncbi:MAG: hydroxymethylglutaryl-CoA synthase [Terriglobia bacterium]|nr:MAG: hydroxymethylglutaryl-CoA synthase [Terriglobia bacterium]